MDVAGPLSLNLYTYCGNNPIMYVDPSGYIREPGYVNGVWCENPDLVEFGEDSDTYKIILDLSERWLNATDEQEREIIHSLAEDARAKQRQKTPYKYGQDIVYQELAKNMEYVDSMGFDSFWYIFFSGGHLEAETSKYLWFVSMTCSDWDYKYNPNWQVPYPIFNGVNMNETKKDGSQPKNWTPWIYFEGQYMAADKFGNLNLGYVGTKMGYGGVLLINPATSGAGDQEWIEFGIKLANEGK